MGNECTQIYSNKVEPVLAWTGKWEVGTHILSYNTWIILDMERAWNVCTDHPWIYYEISIYLNARQTQEF